MHKRLKIPSVLSLSLLLLVSCSDRQDSAQTQQERLRPVKTMIVGGDNDGQWREFPGVVDASKKADLSFRVAGKLVKLMTKEGEVVTKGKTLAQLDKDDFKLKLSSRKAEFDKAHSDFKRAEGLVEAGHVSRADYDKLKAQYETAKVNLEIAEKNLEHTDLIAPFNGRIAKRHVENFLEVTDKQAIYTLQDTSSLRVKVDVPESVMIKVKKHVKPDIFAIFDTIPGKQFPLTFSEVASQADENTNTYQVTFNMPSIEGYNVLPGMSVTVRGKRPASVSGASNRIIIPAHTVLKDDKGNFVFVVTKKDEQTGEVQRKDVITGEISNQGITIVSGLVAGDQVVIAGMSKMFSGLRVRLLPQS